MSGLHRTANVRESCLAAGMKMWRPPWAAAGPLAGFAYLLEFGRPAPGGRPTFTGQRMYLGAP